MNGFVSIFRHDIYIRLHFHVEWLNAAAAATATDAQFQNAQKQQPQIC